MRVAIIGAGIIGASAARHMARDGHEVILIGPGEPADAATHDGVFASHYDAGRITRVSDADPVWARLARASIDRYDEVAAEAGQSFHRPVGLLAATAMRPDWMARLRDVQRANGIAPDDLTGPALAARFPYLRFPDGTDASYEPAPAGYIDPRAYVAATIAAAERAGAHLIRAETHALETSDRGVRIRLADGGALRADHAILAAGAWSNTLLPRPLEMTICARTVYFLHLSEGEARRLASMPSIILRMVDDSDPYILPPIRYPDGSYRIKIGGEAQSPHLTTRRELAQWFQSGGSGEAAGEMARLLHSLVFDVQVLATSRDACAISYTAHGYPYIGPGIGPGGHHVTIATGGCGAAAKSGDEIGRLAMRAALGDCDPVFAPVWR